VSAAPNRPRPARDPATRHLRQRRRIAAALVYVGLAAVLVALAWPVVSALEGPGRAGCPGALRAGFRAAFWAVLLLPLVGAFGPAVSVARGRAWGRVGVETGVTAAVLLALVLAVRLAFGGLCGA
jgi:DMSO/TMAO reductase YedYZ heme-binding membrane subunit